MCPQNEAFSIHCHLPDPRHKFKQRKKNVLDSFPVLTQHRLCNSKYNNIIFIRKGVTVVEEKDKLGHPTTNTDRIWNIFIYIVVYMFREMFSQKKKLEKQNENRATE